MKLIDTLNEALGVPSGILDVASEIYNKILSSNIKYIIGEDEEVEGAKYNIISGQFKIGDQIYRKIKYYVLIKPHPNAKEMVITGMSLKGESERIAPTKMVSLQGDVITLIFNFYCPGEKSGDEYIPTISDAEIKKGIKDVLSSEKNIKISSIAHELKHAYDATKKRPESIKQLARYQTIRKLIGINIEPINWFCFSLYFISLTESLVRPTELASLIQSGEVTKKEFLSFLKNNETYKHLNEIKGMSYEKLHKDLFGYMDEIKNYWSDEPDKIEGKTDEDIVELFLTLIRLNLQHNTMSFMSDIVLGDMPPFLAEIFGRKEEIKFLEKTAKKVMKYNNNKDFFTNEINNSAKQADFMIRKLAKLYDIAK